MGMSRKTYWAAPVIVVAAIGGFVAYSGQASADPPLPALTAQQLIANVASAPAVAFSGNLTVTTNIGLPDLSSLQNLLGSQMNIGGLTSLLAGTTNVKVAVDPATGARAEIDSGTSAYVAVANAANEDGWIYLSASNSATHLTGAAKDASDGKSGEPATPTVPTPQSLADQLIGAMSPSTTISVAGNTAVAGRPAYTLDLTPKDPGSLISAVDIEIDASTWMPLGVQIWSTQLAGQAALNVSFTTLSYATPSASLFDFTAPVGTTVQTVDLGQTATDQGSKGSTDGTATPAPSAKVVSGEGWASVAELTNLPASVISALNDPTQLAGLLNGATSGNGHGSRGNLNTLNQLIGSVAQQTSQGMVYSTYLGSLLVTPSGHVFVGAVPASALEAAAQANQ